MNSDHNQGDTDPLVQLTGDSNAAAVLRENLTAIAEQHRNTPLGRLVSDVLAGRRPPRDLENDVAFMDLTRSGVKQYQDYVASLDAQERKALAKQAESLADGSTSDER